MTGLDTLDVNVIKDKERMKKKTKELCQTKGDMKNAKCDPGLDPR